ncbi:MAG: DUF3256 family protein [Bacteroidaceae bacterium]|nr:DUF3256 family protein [Bacteroidaceae bacterium]
MKRVLFIIISLLLTCIAQAQQVRESFINMPDTLSTLLTKVNREDFIDFLDSNMKAEVNNRLGGKSEMTKLTADFLEVKMSSESVFQLKVLTKADGSKLLCTISTVCGPACDSHILFYTTDWQPLDTRSLLPTLPTIDTFVHALPKDASYSLQDARRQVDMLLMKAEMSPEDTALTFTFTTPDYMDPEAVKQIESYITTTVTLHWDGNKFNK